MEEDDGYLERISCFSLRYGSVDADLRAKNEQQLLFFVAKAMIYLVSKSRSLIKGALLPQVKKGEARPPIP
jgi:hypothetical protein